VRNLTVSELIGTLSIMGNIMKKNVVVEIDLGFDGGGVGTEEFDVTDVTLTSEGKVRIEWG